MEVQENGRNAESQYRWGLHRTLRCEFVCGKIDVYKRQVQDFVRRGGTADVFLDKLYDMIDFLFPYYVKEGKNQLVIAVGCTGGKHRSVTVANRLYERLKEHSEIGLKLEHRDIEMDNRTKG